MMVRIAALATAVLVVLPGGLGVSPNLAGCGTHAEPASDLDAGQSEEDVRLDVGPDGSTESLAPRPLAPLSTSRVTSRRPRLRWVLPRGIPDATVDLCLDRACTRPAAPSAFVIGSSYAPDADLPVGTVFWRLHPSTRLSVTSPTWQFTVGARSAAVDSSWGTTLDVNGDGFADVVVGEPGGPGAAHVYLGSATGLGATPATTLLGFTVGAPFAGFGSSVASAGDVNGDGFADLAVVTNADILVAVYVYPGGPAGIDSTPITTLFPPNECAQTLSMASAGDVNGDGYADIIAAACDRADCAWVYLGTSHGIDPKPAATVTAPEGGFTAMASAGDVNGDGYGDVAVEESTSQGTLVAIYLGSGDGLVTTPATSVTDPDSMNDGFAQALASAGDVNSDGYADLVAGAPFASPANASDGTGSAFIYLGSARGLASSATTTLVGTKGEDASFGAAVFGASD
jgi:FG-GAP-like repeat/FG-GAP repeat